MKVLKCRYGIMAHVVHLVNREYGAMARDYYTLGFLDSVSTGNGTFVYELPFGAVSRMVQITNQ